MAVSYWNHTYVRAERLYCPCHGHRIGLWRQSYALCESPVLDQPPSSYPAFEYYANKMVAFLGMCYVHKPKRSGASSSTLGAASSSMVQPQWRFSWIYGNGDPWGCKLQSRCNLQDPPKCVLCLQEQGPHCQVNFFCLFSFFGLELVEWFVWLMPGQFWTEDLTAWLHGNKGEFPRGKDHERKDNGNPCLTYLCQVTLTFNTWQNWKLW